MTSLSKGDFSLLKYSSPVGGCPAGKGVCVGKAPTGVVGFGTAMAGKAAPWVLATPEGAATEGTY